MQRQKKNSLLDFCLIHFCWLQLSSGKVHDLVDVVVDADSEGHSGGGARFFALLAGGGPITTTVPARGEHRQKK